MKQFLTLTPPQEALDKYLAQVEGSPIAEEIQTTQALGRVTAESIRARFDLPSFDRSAMDGYAVRAADTFGSTDEQPGRVRLIGEVTMGSVSALRVEKGTAVLIHTGGALPEGADAVLILENTRSVKSGEIEVHRTVASGENIIRKGEDVKDGEEVIAKGVRIRPAEIGGLMSLGITRFMAARQPKVAIISTGDEVVSPGKALEPGQVYDVNTYTIGALVSQFGGIPIPYGIVSDNADDLFKTAGQALEGCDLLVIAAGSSASERDITAEIINRLGAPGVVVHGVNVRPGKPTILGICDQKPVIGLPGNPVSAIVIARKFLRPIIDKYLGLKPKPYRPLIEATLSMDVTSPSGREDWVPVILHEKNTQFLAEPVFFLSNLIFTLVRADGIIRIPHNSTGLSAGDLVEVEILT